METEIWSLSGLGLIFVLGLRHGLDPDHIAMIDSMVSLRLARETRETTQAEAAPKAEANASASVSQRALSPQYALWIGTLFALGHGLAVTAIAVALGLLAGDVVIHPSMGQVLEWMPVALLILVGSLNLRNLLRPHAYQVTGWKSRFIPARLRNSTHPFAVFLTGVLFALVFDTVTQAAAWGYAATAHAGVGMALLLGLVFTAGMVITDTLDGRLMVRLLRRLSDRRDALSYRRKVGWMIVVLSFGIAFYSIGAEIYPSMALGDTLLSLIGFFFVLMLCIGYGLMLWRTSVLPSTTSLPSVTSLSSPTSPLR